MFVVSNRQYARKRRRSVSERRATYLPITSIVVGIIILAVAVGLVSFRDIARGRQQVADVLEHQATAIVRLLWSDLRVQLGAPNWQRSRVDLVLEHFGTREEIAYLAVLTPEGRILFHSDPERVGDPWPPDLAPHPPVPGRPPAGRLLSYGGRSVYQLAAVLELDPADPHHPMGRAMGRRPMRRTFDLPTVIERLSELLGRPLEPGEVIPLVFVVGIDAADIESAFLASRNHTLMLSAILLIIGGVAIYFLFVLAHYRSARTALANMRSYTTNVIESMASGLVSTDPDGRVVTVNSSARRLLRLGDAEISGKDIADVLTLEPDLERAGVGPVVRGARDMAETETTILVSGEPLPVALSASSLRDEEGARAGTVVLFQDLTEVEALKDEVERARHLASLGRLAAGVAHEVRNPLSSLKGFAQLLRSRFRPGSDEERYADIMIEEVERLDRVVQELLDFAKPVTPDRKPSALNAIVDEALGLISDDAAFRRISIEKRLAGGLPDALVDPFQIRQALLNVFLNGIEAMGEGGVLSIETGVADQPGTVSVGVADTGEGMTPDEIDRLFEPFYTTKPTGTGLGLTIVARLVEQNGGQVAVSSVKGRGSTFTILLPAATGGRPDRPTGPGGRPAPEGE
jgi:two-component system sensor histidine kinase HydH